MDRIDDLIKQLQEGKLTPEEYSRRLDELLAHARFAASQSEAGSGAGDLTEEIQLAKRKALAAS